LVDWIWAIRIKEEKVAIVVKGSAISAMKKVGVQPHLLDWVSACGAEVKLTASEFQFCFVDEAGEKHQKTVKVTLDELQKLSAGTLQLSAKLNLADQLQDAIKSLMDSAHAIPLEQPPTAVQMLDALPPLAPAQVNPGQTAVVEAKTEVGEAKSWPTFDVNKLKTAELTKLRDATMLYQPVHGTSNGSRYFLIAANKDVRVAARLKQSTLSIRIEGPAWEKHMGAIKECGFQTVDKTKGYASVHLSVGDDMMLANKTLGAVLLGLGVPLETPLPNLKLIKGVM
jgi:hypothetical protein